MAVDVTRRDTHIKGIGPASDTEEEDTPAILVNKLYRLIFSASM